MTKKLLSVDNLDVVRDFVFSAITNETNDLKTELSDETQAYLTDKLNEAEDKIRTDYESKHNELLEKLEKLKQEGVNNDVITELELQINTLKTNYNDMLNSLNAIKDSVNEIGDSVMSESQLNELIQSALIKETTITNDMVTTPNVFASNLVALIAKFGTIRALNIIGDEIEGKTISSIDGNWHIGKDGDGSLADGNISWDSNGNVELGSGVKLKWDSIDNKPTDLATTNDVTTITQNMISTAEISADKITTGTLSADRLNIDDITVKKLNTTGNKTGNRVVAEGNTISIYNGNNEISCQITNDSTPTTDIDTLLKIEDSDITKTFYNEYTDLLGEMICSAANDVKTNTTILNRFDIKTDNNKSLRNDTFSIGGQIKLENFRHDVGDIMINSLTYNIGVYFDSMFPMIIRNISGRVENIDLTNDGLDITIPTHKIIAPYNGNYYIIPTISFEWYCPSKGSSMVFETYHCDQSFSLNVTGKRPIKPKSYIYDDGVVFKNGNGGVLVNSDEITLKCGNSRITLTDDKIFMGFDTTQLREVKPISITTGSGIQTKTVEVLGFGGYKLEFNPGNLTPELKPTEE